MQSMHDSDSGERVANPGWADSWNGYRYTMMAADGTGETLTVSVLPVTPEDARVTLRVESIVGMELVDITPADAATLGALLTILASDLQREAYR